MFAYWLEETQNLDLGKFIPLKATRQMMLTYSLKSFTVAVLKLDQTGSHSLPRRLKGRSKDDSDEAGIRACQACMDCLERYIV